MASTHRIAACLVAGALGVSALAGTADAAEVRNEHVEFRFRGAYTGLWLIADIYLNHDEAVAASFLGAYAAAHAAPWAIPIILGKTKEFLDHNGQAGVHVHLEMTIATPLSTVEVGVESL